MSPYFSPKKAIAPSPSACSRRRLVDTDGLVGQDLEVHEVLHALDLLLGHRPEVAEVESQAVRGDERALLANMIAQHPAQRPVKKVGSGVIATDRLAAVGSIAATASCPASIEPSIR